MAHSCAGACCWHTCGCLCWSVCHMQVPHAASCSCRSANVPCSWVPAPCLACDAMRARQFQYIGGCSKSTCDGIWPASDEVCCPAEQIDICLEVTRGSCLAWPFRGIRALIPEVWALHEQRSHSNMQCCLLHMQTSVKVVAHGPA